MARRVRRAYRGYMDTTTQAWVAIIDDEEPIRRALLRLLRSADIDARAFATGADLLDALAAGAPYCVVLDLHMPAMDGFTLMDELAARAPATALIAMTGHDGPEVAARALSHGPLACLHKPMDDAALLAALATARTLHDRQHRH